jgi:hypothetical protein
VGLGASCHEVDHLTGGAIEPVVVIYQQQQWVFFGDLVEQVEDGGVHGPATT